jgi:uncharacterized protein (DUF1778 family)
MATTGLAPDSPRKSTRRSRRTSRPGAKTSGKAKSAPMSLRMDAETRTLIDRAASVVGQNRTDFMLASARDRATEILLNQTFFALPKSDWDAFVGALDSPPPPNAKLKALLARKMPWESEK